MDPIALLGLGLGVAGGAFHVTALVLGLRFARTFLATHDRLASERDLEAFRRHAARDSHLALAAIGVAVGTPTLAGLVGGAAGATAACLAYGAVVTLSLPLALWCQALTRAIRALPVEPALAPIAAEVTRQWIREPVVRVPARADGALALAEPERPTGGELSIPNEVGRLSTPRR